MKNLFSGAILRQSLQKNWKLWLILSVIGCFVMVIILSVAKSHPAMIAASGGILGLVGNSVFEGMAMVYVIVYVITVGNKLVASEVDRGYLSFTLNTPTTRLQIILSKALFFITSVMGICLCLGAVGSIAAAVMKLDFDYGVFWVMVLGFSLFSIAAGAICFAASCLFNRSAFSITTGAGVLLVFYLCKTISNLKGFEFLKYFSLQTLFAPENIIAGSNYLIQFAAMFLIAVGLYTFGVVKFLRKDLPL